MYFNATLLFFNTSALVYIRVSQPVGHGRIFDGPRSCIIEIEYVLQDDPRKQGLLLP